MSSNPSQPTVADVSAAEQAAAPSTLEGWASFRKAVNVTLPNLLSQAEQLSATTHRLLGIGNG